jgi:RimJ/RimL family protein N-acetyltransferase
MSRYDAPETARLRFRPAGDDDLAVVHAHWNDGAVRRYLWDDAPVPLETARSVLATSAADFARDGFGLWILELADGGFAGVCGLRRLEGSADLELVYSLEHALWGRGLATEAARAVVAWAFERLGLARVLAGVDPPNVASTRVLQKIGMTPLVADAAAGGAVRTYAVTRERFAATSA